MTGRPFASIVPPMARSIRLVHDVDDALPNNIRKYRERAGLSLQQLGEKANTSHQQISKLERGLLRFTDRWAKRLAAPLGCDFRDLFKDAAGAAPRGMAEGAGAYAAAIDEDDVVALMVNKYLELTGATPDDATLLSIRREIRATVRRLR